MYRKSYELVLEVYTCTRSMPREEQYGLVGQMRRAAVSIPLNIAEGYGRDSAKETRRFLSMGRGSSTELEVLIELARDLRYLEEDKSTALLQGYAEVGRMLTGLMQVLEKTTDN